MAYDTRALFAQGIKEAATYYRSMERQNSWLSPFDIDKAWGLYLRARKPSLGFAVIGRTVVDKLKPADQKGPLAPAQPKDFGNAIDFVEHFNFGGNSVDAELADYTGFDCQPGHVGSILTFYAGAKTPGNNGWHFAYNDAWILGGVHSHLDFHLASPRLLSNVWDSRRNEITVTGRELCGLVTFGYGFAKTAFNELVVCRNERAADDATFGSYIATIRRYSHCAERVLHALVSR